MSLNIGTGKLNVKNPSEKWGGLVGKFLRTFYAIVVFSVAVFVLCSHFFFFFFFFDSCFVETLAAFNC